MAAHGSRVIELVADSVRRFNLRDRPVLEVGSDRGYLQDIANDYVSLDISPGVARFYYKKFVLGSATALPFADNSFGGAWSIWVFEHVPNPEQAFRWRSSVDRRCTRPCPQDVRRIFSVKFPPNRKRKFPTLITVDRKHLALAAVLKPMVQF